MHTSEPPSILTDVVLGQLEHGSERHDILGRRCPSCEIVGHRDSPPGRLGRSFGQNLEDLLGPVPRNNTHGQALWCTRIRLYMYTLTRSPHYSIALYYWPFFVSQDSIRSFLIFLIFSLHFTIYPWEWSRLIPSWILRTGHCTDENPRLGQMWPYRAEVERWMILENMDGRQVHDHYHLNYHYKQYWVWEVATPLFDGRD